MQSGPGIGNKIGEGGCAEVFEWEDGSKIIKLAKPNTIPAALQAELHHCQTAWACGLPVPRPYDLVVVEGRSGIVFERIYGDPIIKRFVERAVEQSRTQQPIDIMKDYIEAKITAKLFHQIHSHAVAKMPSQQENIKNDINRAQYLTDAEKAAVIAELDGLPIKQQLCHGDPNPGNILVRDNDAVIIDWNNASTGNPEADLAEYVIMIRYAILPHICRVKPVFFLMLQGKPALTCLWKSTRGYLASVMQMLNLGSFLWRHASWLRMVSPKRKSVCLSTRLEEGSTFVRQI